LSISSILSFPCSRLRLLPSLPVTVIIPSTLPSMTCLRRKLLRKTWPIQLAFLLVIVLTIFLSILTLCKTLFFQTIYPTELHPSAVPNFKLSSISDLLFEVSNFQHQTKICSKYKNLLISSLNSMSNLPVNVLLLVERCFCHNNPGFNFTCTQDLRVHTHTYTHTYTHTHTHTQTAAHQSRPECIIRGTLIPDLNSAYPLT
jgi:hypothetical protein